MEISYLFHLSPYLTHQLTMHIHVTLFFILFALAASAQDKPLPNYTREWNKADSLVAKGLPKSALAIANRIYEEAKAQKNYAQLAKAAMSRMIFRSSSDENAYVALIQSIQEDIQQTPEPAKSVLESVLGGIYWQYFQQNRYRFYNRATVNTKDAATNRVSDSTKLDFRTWDARQFIEATTAAFRASLRPRALLQKTPIAEFDVLLEKGDPTTRPLRPTVYDLLAHRALDFFHNTEPDLLKPVFKFELDKPDYLAIPEVFAQLPLQSLDSLSGRYQALLVYQHLIAQHLNNPDALADVDAMRLKFVYDHTVNSDKDSLYRQTLEKQIATFKNKPAGAVYAFQLAEWLVNTGEKNRSSADENSGDEPAKEAPNHWNRKQAADICRSLVSRFPKTLSGEKAAILLGRLLETACSLQVEGVNVPDQPFRALVHYQNASKLLYRIIRYSATNPGQYRTDFIDDSKKKKILKAWLEQSALAENSLDLPDDGDLNSHSVEVPFSGLPIGQYVLLMTSQKSFRTTPENIQYALFLVSKLGYIVRQEINDYRKQLIVVTDRVTGEPIQGAQVVAKDDSRPVPQQNVAITDKDGMARVQLSYGREANYYYTITVDNDSLQSDQQYFYPFNRDEIEAPSRKFIQLFTDRAIYRPWQLIYVKGLLYQGKSNQYAVEGNEQVKIELLDGNQKLVASQLLKTNEFGTFAATFNAPVGRLTGLMTLVTPYGSEQIRVEEYKRPTFEVKIKPSRQSVKLGQDITLVANAKTFSGAVVDGASVRYRVVRKLRPRWYWWYRPQNSGQAEIASGVASTDPKGEVRINFKAIPDPEKSQDEVAVFDFDITLDVTDLAGETRSATHTLHIGYTALQAEIDIPDQLEKGALASFPVRVKNQSDVAVAAKGQLVMYPLQPPARPLRNRLWERPDRQLLSRDAFGKQFPNDLYANENDPRSWPRGEAIQRIAITSPTDSLVTLPLDTYPAGEYLAELTMTDSLGEKVISKAFFGLIDEKNPVAPARPDAWVQIRKTTVEPGQDAIFWVGNRQPGWILMIIEENRKIVQQKWLKTNGRPQRVNLPVREQQRGGFAVHFAMIQNGRLYEKSQLITVPFSNKQLAIETQTFRNKLKPGEREEWTLKVSGMSKSPAEVMATLYDASLDAFARLNWQTTFYRQYFPGFYNWHSSCFTAKATQAFNYVYPSATPYPERNYDQLIANSLFDEDAIRGAILREENTIKGVLKMLNGSGVSGVTITIKGTSTGTVTNTNGEFSLKAATKSPVTLTFMYVGYQSQSITVGQIPLSFLMKANNMALNEVVVTGYGRKVERALAGRVAGISVRGPAPMAMAKMAADQAEGQAEPVDKSTSSTQQELVNPRKNFNETAFFVPQMKTDEQGRVVLKFTMPEALTRWRLLAFAHTPDMKVGTLEREIVTQKELMITANAPRFLREGDTIRVMARVNNLSEKPLSILASLALSNALTGEPIHAQFGLSSLQTSVQVPAGQGQAVGWTLVVPAGLETVTCRLTAQSGAFTDGEEFSLPILPNRMLVTDSQPFWVNGPGAKTFTLKPLASLNPELPVRHERLTVEVTSNPGWYALQSLPYLMEYRYECAEQLFSRLYANSLAAYIVNSKPVFKQVIAEWQKNPPKSPLETNEELKNVVLENSPWLASARSETERQAKLGQLLDANRMEAEQRRAIDKLQQLQTESGGFRWFGGMMPDLSMTLHILSGLGHLQKLGVRFPDDLQTQVTQMQNGAVNYVDGELQKWVEREKKEATKAKNGFSGWYFSAAQYLYARSFYTNKPIDKALLAYVKQRVTDGWLKQSFQGQALSAMALNRFGEAKMAKAIVASLREHSRKSDEMGMYWPDNVAGLYWYQTPIETQSYLIEAFSEIDPVPTEIDDMRRWLLRQKQTQSWSSTKATTEAIYALLLQGNDWLSTGANTQVSLGGQPIESRVTKADAITGYEKVTYAASEIKPQMATIQLSKTTNGPAWGALYWQHFEPLDKVMPGSAGLSVQKTLYVQQDSPSGPIISTVSTATHLNPGDLIKVRLILKTDREMQYVHLKDSRASGFEPIAVLSGYKFQNGLGYYEAPRDASTDFFISYLPVGTHVFEYDLRVAQTGDFAAGVATVQCFYAPEFSAHSAGERVLVK